MSVFMDKELDKSIIRKRRGRLLCRLGIVAVCIIAVCYVAAYFAGASVRESDLRFGVVDAGVLEASISASGRVVPAFEQTLSSPISSRIVHVYARVGDTLQVGTPLMQLDLRREELELQSMHDRRRIKEQEMHKASVNNSTRLSDIMMQVEVKEMTVNRLAADLDSERRLDSIGSGTGEKVRQAELAYRTALLELAQLRKLLDGEKASVKASENVSALDLSAFDKEIATKQSTLSESRLLSPCAGVLTYISEELGANVGAGEKVAVISDLSHFKVTGSVSDVYVDQLSVGQRVTVAVASTRVEGTISNIEPSANGGVVNFTVKLSDDDNPRLRPGLKTDVYIITDVRENTLRLPRGSYFSGKGDIWLWVLSADGRSISRRKVTLGDANSDYVEVREGLSPGDRVVINRLETSATRTKLRLK